MHANTATSRLRALAKATARTVASDSVRVCMEETGGRAACAAVVEVVVCVVSEGRSALMRADMASNRTASRRSALANARATRASASGVNAWDEAEAKSRR